MSTSTPMCIVCWEPLPETADGTRRFYHRECRKKRKKGRQTAAAPRGSLIVAPTEKNLKTAATMAAIAKFAREKKR